MYHSVFYAQSTRTVIEGLNTFYHPAINGKHIFIYMLKLVGLHGGFRTSHSKSNQHTRELISAPKYVIQVQKQKPESPTVTLTWHACKYKTYTELHQRCILKVSNAWFKVSNDWSREIWNQVRQLPFIWIQYHAYHGCWLLECAIIWIQMNGICFHWLQSTQYHRATKWKACVNVPINYGRRITGVQRETPCFGCRLQFSSH